MAKEEVIKCQEKFISYKIARQRKTLDQCVNKIVAPTAKEMIDFAVYTFMIMMKGRLNCCCITPFI